MWLDIPQQVSNARRDIVRDVASANANVRLRDAKGGTQKSVQWRGVNVADDPCSHSSVPFMKAMGEW